MGQNSNTTAPLLIGNIVADLIKIQKTNFNNEVKETVNARELWQKLEVKSKFADWIKNNIQDFIENIDFITISKNLENGGRTIEYYLSIEMAKHLCMLAKTEQGKLIRQYFIQCEKKLKEVLVPKIDSQFLLQISQRMAELENKIEEDKPKVEFFDTVTQSDSWIDIGEVAKILNCGLGRNSLFKFLREKDVLTTKNIPYQTFIGRGYFKLVETKQESNNFIRVFVKTVVSQKGLDFIRKTLKNNNNLI